MCLRVLWWLIKPILALNCLNANRESQFWKWWRWWCLGWEIYFIKNENLLPFLSYCAGFAQTFFFNNSTCAHQDTCKLSKVWEACVTLSAMTIFTASLGSSLIVCWSTKTLYPSYRFDDAKLLESVNPVSYTDHTQLTMYYIWLQLYGYYQCFFTFPGCPSGFIVQQQQ